MRAFKSTKNRAVIPILALLGLTSAATVVRGFENGSFDEGLAGWQVESARKAIGLASAEAESEVVQLQQEETLAALRIHASAGTVGTGAGPGGAAVSQARLQQDIVDIPSTVLTFDWAAEYWGAASGRGVITHRARLIVERHTPYLRHEFDLLEQNTWRLSDSCGVAVIIDGRPYEESFYTDLSAVGFEPGDDIRVALEIRAQTRALRSCDYAAFGGMLMVDRFVLRRCALIQHPGRRSSASQPRS